MTVANSNLTVGTKSFSQAVTGDRKSTRLNSSH